MKNDKGMYSVTNNLRLEKTLNDWVINGGNLAAAQRKNGYSEAYIQSHKITKTKYFKMNNEDAIKKMDEIRKKTLRILNKDERLAKASTRDIKDVHDSMLKSSQLLGGYSTENISYSIQEDAPVKPKSTPTKGLSEQIQEVEDAIESEVEAVPDN